MYVSYGITVGLGIVTSSAMFLLNYSPIEIIITLSIILILIAPLSFRWSRMIWLNMFVHYNETSIKQKESQAIK